MQLKMQEDNSLSIGYGLKSTLLSNREQGFIQEERYAAAVTASRTTRLRTPPRRIEPPSALVKSWRLAADLREKARRDFEVSKKARRDKGFDASGMTETKQEEQGFEGPPRKREKMQRWARRKV